MARDRSLPFGSRTGVTSATPITVALPEDWSDVKVWVDVASYGGVGSAYAAPAVASVNGITTIRSLGVPTAGTFTITALPNTPASAVTVAIPYNETAANIKTALVNTGLFATGDITAAGGALPADVTLTWTGVYAGTVPPLYVTSSVTGGQITSLTTTKPVSNGGYAYLEATLQEMWERSDSGGAGSRFLYIATVTGAGNYRVSVYK